MAATAPPARRFLLVEVAGPWPRQAIIGSWPERSRLDRRAAARLVGLTGPHGVRLLAIRRYGDSGRGPDRAWGVADATPDRQAIRWGRWREAADLLDVAAAWAEGRLTDGEPAAAGETLALVCTHGGHDPCCAIRGRPVAAALSASSPASSSATSSASSSAMSFGTGGVDVWECSHISGDRFAGNLLLLPEGLLFGGLDGPGAQLAVERHAAGRLLLDHYRGRFGQPRPAQAAEYHARLALGDDALGAVRVLSSVPAGPVDADGSRAWRAVVEHRGRRHAVDLVQRWSEPARMTCTSGPDRVDRYELVRLSPLD